MLNIIVSYGDLFVFLTMMKERNDKINCRYLSLSSIFYYKRT